MLCYLIGAEHTDHYIVDGYCARLAATINAYDRSS